MKITHVGPTGGPERRRRIGGDGKRGEVGFTVGAGDGVGSGGEIAPASPLGALGAVLSVQEVSDPAAERRQAIAHGHGLLDELHRLRLGLIDDQLSEATLRRLAHLLETGPIATEDRRLDAVLEAIELRAAVELAKLERQDCPPHAET